jgi:hypothetical protein
LLGLFSQRIFRTCWQMNLSNLQARASERRQGREAEA